MKTRVFNLMALFFVAALTLSFTACGGDDDGEYNTVVNPQNLDDESKYFVGAWNLWTGNDNYFIFFPNGRAIRGKDIYISYNGFTSIAYDYVGRWQYNSDTKLLATTFYLWQLIVTAQFENSFTAVTINTSSMVNASRLVDTYYATQFFKSVDFTDEDGYNPLKSTSMYYNYTDVKEASLDGNTIKGVLRYYYSYYSGTRKIESETLRNFTVTDAYSDHPKLTIHSNDKDYAYPFAGGTYVGEWVGE